MYDAVAGNMIEGIARHFLSFDEDVVSSGSLSFHPKSAEHQSHHVDISVEGEVHVLFFGDVREHEIAHVCIYAPASAFPSIGGYVVAAAIVQVYFILY